MKLNVKPVTRRLPEFAEICKLMKTAFPKDELISLSMWRILAFRKNICFSAVYDAQKFIGIVYTAENEKYMYIPFLAICESERNKGYGSQILKWLKDQYQKTLVLHIEPLDPSAENYEQRVRRADFYHRNEIKDTYYRFNFLSVPFAVYSSDCDNFDVSIHNGLMRWFSFNLLKFNFVRVKN